MSWLRSEKAAGKLGLLVALLVLAPLGWAWSWIRWLLGGER